MEVLASKTKVYMVLEHVSGGELFDRVVRTFANIPYLLLIIAHCISGVQNLHKCMALAMTNNVLLFILTGIQR